MTVGVVYGPVNGSKTTTDPCSVYNTRCYSHPYLSLQSKKKKKAFIALPVVVSTIVSAILMPLFLSLSSPVPVKIFNGRGPESTCRELMGDVEAVCSYKGVGCGVWGAHLVSIHS